MKQKKRVFAVILVITILISIMPAKVQATEEGQTDIKAGSATVEGTNDFGYLLSQSLEENQEDSEAKSVGYSVTGLEIEGNVATVTFDTLATANLVVAIYTEDALRLVTSGLEEVSAGQTEATVYIDGVLPEYFMASAYLLDCDDYSPLCVPYDTPMYTQEMQALLASTVNDYDADRVLNLDDDDNTNFAVFAEDVVIIEDSEDCDTMVVENEENNTYTIQNANENITSLTEGDVFAYPYGDDVLIAKVGDISIDGTTVTITRADVEIEEVFTAVKLESQSDTKDIMVDASTAAAEVTYTGLSTNSNLTRAVTGGGDVTAFHEFKIGAKLDEENGNISTNSSIEGLLKIKMDVSVKWYITLNRQYVEFKATPSINASIALTGSIAENIPLGTFAVSPVPGVYVGFEPKFVCKFTGTVQLSATLTATLGVRYDNKSIINLSSTPQIEFDFKVEGSLFLGVDLAPKVTLLGDYGAKLSLSSNIGVQIKATGTGSIYDLQKENAESHHDCQECLEIKPEFQAKLTGKIKFLGLEWLSASIKIGEWTVPLGELYYSLDRNEFGSGTCPYISYRVTIAAIDSEKKAVSGTGVSLSDGTVLGTTNANGVLVVYLRKGNYIFTVEIEEKKVSAEVSVTEACKVVFNPDGLVTTRIYADEITDYGATKASGSCGDNLRWTLYNSGFFVISGTGSMRDYGLAAYTPWYNYADSITAVVVQNGATSVSSNAFRYCSNLTSVRLADSVKNIDYGAFYGCSNLSTVTMGNGLTSIGQVAFYDCKNLINVKLGNGLIEIGPNAFQACSMLRSITLPEGVTTIGDSAFSRCGNLRNINIPDSVTTIGSGAFRYCNLNNVIIPVGIRVIEEEAFAYCSNLSQIIIPDSVTEIKIRAFYKCSSLASIILGSGVETIGDYVFFNCYNLREVKFRGNAPSKSSLFSGLTLTAYYPSNNSTWTTDAQKKLGGTITWISYTLELSTATNDTISTFSIHGGSYGTEILDDYTLKSASFSNLVPEKEYVLLALSSVETENLLAADNLLFIQQKAAAADGTLIFQYIQRVAQDPSYVMACGATADDLCNATITFPKMYADSLVQVVDPVVTYNNEVLVEGRDYVIVGTVDYTKSGQYICYVRGIGNYTGLVECNYIVNPQQTTELRFAGASLSLQHNLAINYKVDKALFEEMGYKDPYVVFELNGVKERVSSYSVSGNRYVFTFPNIAPNQMNDIIYATLYATHDGVEYASAVREYSVAEYCYSMLDLYSDDAYAELRTLLVDLLHYGAKSQIYTSYKADTLVNAQLTEAQLAWGTSGDPELGTVLNPTYQTVENPTAIWKGAGLYLQESVSVRLKFTADSIENLTVKIESGTKTWTIAADKFIEEDGAYYVYFSGLDAGQMRQTLYLTLCNGDTPVSNTACYSIESYAYEKQNSTIDGLAELVKAMMRYGDSAYAYAN